MSTLPLKRKLPPSSEPDGGGPLHRADGATATSESDLPDHLHRYLGRCGHPNKAAAALVAGGRVTLVAASASTGAGAGPAALPIGPDCKDWEGVLVYSGDTVLVDGEPVRPAPAVPPRTFAYHKPMRVIADSDAGTVLRAVGDRMVPPSESRVAAQPVGQLDVNTTGLLLFSTCGLCRNYLLLPGLVPKTYVASYTGPVGKAPTQTQLGALVAGVDIARPSERAGPEVVRFESAEFAGSTEWIAPVRKAVRPADVPYRELYRVRVTLRTGKNHVVKRMLHAVGLPPVRFLYRERIGGLVLDDLTGPGGGALGEGEFVELNEDQCALAGVPTQGQLDALRRCRLLCRSRTGAPDPRLRDWLARFHTLEGPCFAGIPGLSCDMHDGSAS